MCRTLVYASISSNMTVVPIVIFIQIRSGLMDLFLVDDLELADQVTISRKFKEQVVRPILKV